jgi:hypothetical protein
MSLMRACTNALGMDHPADQVDGDRKLKRWLIGVTIAQAAKVPSGEAELTSEEVAEVIAACKPRYPGVILGVVKALLDPSELEKKALALIGGEAV